MVSASLHEESERAIDRKVTQHSIFAVSNLLGKGCEAWYRNLSNHRTLTRQAILLDRRVLKYLGEEFELLLTKETLDECENTSIETFRSERIVVLFNNRAYPWKECV